MINVGVVGYGYWGPNLIRNVYESDGAALTEVCDQSAERLKMLQQRYPAVSVMTDYSEFLASSSLDAVAIATPVSTHFGLAQQALSAGKHVFVEKPLAATPEQASELIDLAASKRVTLMVGHTFVYAGAVRKIKDVIDEGVLGDRYYYDSVRVNLGLFQHDVNVIWDLAVHDLAILDYLFYPERPAAITATGVCHAASSMETIAYLTLLYPDNFIAHVNVNWLSPVKMRRTLIGGSRKMILYDDLEPSEKIKIYDKGVVLTDDPANIYRMLVGYRAGDVWMPQIDLTEALSTEMRHFVDCICTGRRPVTDGEAGLRVVKLLHAACSSMRQNGQVVEL